MDGRTAASLQDIKNACGENAVLAFLMTAVSDYLDLVGDTAMGAAQIKRVAEEIFLSGDQRNLNVADVKLCFSRMLRAKQYGPVNAGKIINAFADYWAERLNAADEASYREHLSATAGRRSEPLPVARNLTSRFSIRRQA